MSTALPITIVPSYPAPSWSALAEKLQQLSGVAREFQVDIVAAEFAGTVSWPETEVDPQAALAKLAKWSGVYQLELDLMVPNPQEYLPLCGQLGIKRVVIHLFADLDVRSVVESANDYGLTVSLAATADVPLARLEDYITDKLTDSVQLMGIAAVGKQGQSFDERVLPRIRSLRTQFPDLSIAVDGAVNLDTLPLLYAAGANRFAPGSAVIKADDSVEAYKQLQDLLVD